MARATTRFHFLVLALLGSASISHAQWQGLPFKLNHGPASLFVDTTEDVLYMGGQFTTVDDTACNVLRWDGAHYTRLPLIPGFSIRAITRFGGRLCVGTDQGAFFLNGNGWDTITRRATIALVHLQGKLALVGYGPNSGSTNFQPVRLWDGTAAPLQDLYGLDTVQTSILSPTDLHEYNSEIFLTGNIDAQPFGTREILRWNGTQWSDMSGGVPGHVEYASDLEEWNGHLYVASQHLGGTHGNTVLRWNGANWQRLGSGPAGDYVTVATSLSAWRGRLVATGNFDSVGGIRAENVAAWDGSRWCSFGSTFHNGYLTRAISFRDTLYVAGYFDAVGSDSISFLARWVGDTTLDTCSLPAVITTLDVEDVVAPDSFQYTLSPNPFTDALTIRWTSQPKSVITYTIHDAIGRAVHRSTGAQTSSTFSLAHLPAGLYIMRIEDATGNVRVAKILKE